MPLKKLFFTVFLMCLIAIGGIYSVYVHVTPRDFPTGKSFVVDEGDSLYTISVRLKEDHIITSALLFRVAVSFFGYDKHVQLGVYTFNQPENLAMVVKKFTLGIPDAPLLSVTIPEGSTTHEVAEIVQKVFPEIAVDTFEEKVFAKQGDGKLFPSTYYLLPSYTEDKILDLMMSTFEKKYAANFSKDSLPLPLIDRDQLISLAAILEGEAKTKEDMQMVAGILLKRLTMNFPLQVDVAKETYKTKGLPAQPINNPGLISLYAALHPTQSPYLYYLTGKDGIMHYAKTFEEHKKNIQLYLR